MNSISVICLIMTIFWQFSKGFEKGVFKWIKYPCINHSSIFQEHTFNILLSENERYIEPEYPPIELIQIPGGLCPKLWSEKYDGLGYSLHHNLDLNYWWKWPGSMVNIELKTDFSTLTNDEYFLRVEDALKKGVCSIILEYSLEGSCHVTFPKQKPSFMKSLKNLF